jgi:hypothetical protein
MFPDNDEGQLDANDDPEPFEFCATIHPRNDALRTHGASHATEPKAPERAAAAATPAAAAAVAGEGAGGAAEPMAPGHSIVIADAAVNVAPIASAAASAAAAVGCGADAGAVGAADANALLRKEACEMGLTVVGGRGAADLTVVRGRGAADLTVVGGRGAAEVEGMDGCDGEEEEDGYDGHESDGGGTGSDNEAFGLSDGVYLSDREDDGSESNVEKRFVIGPFHTAQPVACSSTDSTADQHLSQRARFVWAVRELYPKWLINPPGLSGCDAANVTSISIGRSEPLINPHADVSSSLNGLATETLQTSERRSRVSDPSHSQAIAGKSGPQEHSNDKKGKKVIYPMGGILADGWFRPADGEPRYPTYLGPDGKNWVAGGAVGFASPEQDAFWVGSGISGHVSTDHVTAVFLMRVASEVYLANDNVYLTSDADSTRGHHQVAARIRLLSAALIGGAETDLDYHHGLSLGLRADSEWMPRHLFVDNGRLSDFCGSVRTYDSNHVSAVPVALRLLHSQAVGSTPAPQVATIRDLIVDWETHLAALGKKYRLLRTLMLSRATTQPPPITLNRWGHQNRPKATPDLECKPTPNASFDINRNSTRAGNEAGNEAGAGNICNRHARWTPDLDGSESSAAASSHANAVDVDMDFEVSGAIAAFERRRFEELVAMRHVRGDPVMGDVRASLMGALQAEPLMMLVTQYLVPSKQHVAAFELVCVPRELHEASLAVLGAVNELGDLFSHRRRRLSISRMRRLEQACLDLATLGISPANPEPDFSTGFSADFFYETIGASLHFVSEMVLRRTGGHTTKDDLARLALFHSAALENDPVHSMARPRGANAAGPSERARARTPAKLQGPVTGLVGNPSCPLGTPSTGAEDVSDCGSMMGNQPEEEEEEEKEVEEEVVLANIFDRYEAAVTRMFLARLPGFEMPDWILNPHPSCLHSLSKFLAIFYQVAKPTLNLCLEEIPERNALQAIFRAVAADMSAEIITFFFPSS